MLSFVNDYSEGAHEQVLRRLAETNREQHPGYGTDPYCARAKEKIRRACGCPEGDVFFLVGGTQTNQAVISALLAPWEGVIAPATGHICTHEAGAIEATGHKVLELPQREGKLSAAGLRTYLEGFYGDENHEHMVFPGPVHRWTLPEAGQKCHRDGGAAERGIPGKGVLLLFGHPHQPDIPGGGPGPAGGPGPEGRIQLLGAAGRGADGDPLRHQLGHPDGGRGGVDPPAVKRAV